jgi:hypothetical protein
MKRCTKMRGAEAADRVQPRPLQEGRPLSAMKGVRDGVAHKANVERPKEYNLAWGARANREQKRPQDRRHHAKKRAEYPAWLLADVSLRRIPA